MTENDHTERETTSSLVGLAFELQRNSLEVGQRTIERTLDTRRGIDERLVGGLERSEEAQEAGLSFTQEAINDLLDVAAGAPGTEDTIEEVRTAVNNGFDSLIEQQGDLYAEVGDRVDPETRERDPIDQELLVALDEQLEFLVDANREIEAQTVESLERIVDELEALADVVSEQSEEVGTQFEAQVDRFGEQLEGQLEGVEERFESRMDRIEDLRDRVGDLRDEVEIEVENPDDATDEE